jgi:hypothetical protein
MKPRGRPLLLGQELDAKVQLYLRKLRETGGVVTSRIAMAAARGIVLKCAREKLLEFGGHIELKRSWAESLLTRMNFVQRKITTAKSKQSSAEFSSLKKSFLDDVTTTVIMESVPPELVLNWDQTGVQVLPASTWTLEE